MSKLKCFIAITFGCLFVSISCQRDNKFNKQMDVSRDFLCCQDDAKYMVIDSFKILKEEEIYLELCKASNDFFQRIILVHTDKFNNNPSQQWDLVTKHDLSEFSINVNFMDSSKFRGDFERMNKLKKGNYRLVLLCEKSCGEIQFKIGDDEEEKTEYFCIDTQCD